MNKNKFFQDYYVGLDIGTNSVGWAVSNPNYKILKFNKKSMWGVRMFEEASTAEERRLFRSNRRRLNRRAYRLDILQDIFRKEILKVDRDFFINLENSSLHIEDKEIQNKYPLFNEEGYRDKEYYEKYPTIYHLRNELISNPKKHDIREVYLALHHIMKYRGHFLFEGELKSDNNIDDSLHFLNDEVLNLYDEKIYVLTEENIEDLKNILKDSSLTVRDRNNQLKKYIQPKTDKETKKILTKISSMIAGMKVTNLVDIFPDLESEDKLSIDFKSESIDEDLENLTILDFEQKKLLEYAKAIYDWGILEEIRDGEKYISVAKINSYEEHGRELKLLKKIIKEGANSEVYDDFFRNKDNKNNYTAYVGNGNTKKANVDSFYRELKKVLKKVKGFSNEKKNILSKIETNTYLMKQRVGSNGVIPHQLHLIELREIIENASNYLEFLNEADESNLTNAEKIIEIFRFRIPYYVGPLNPYHANEENKDGFAWVKRRESGKVYPWNFEEKIDVSKSAEEFIRRMTNKCSYLIHENVLPKHSMLYQKFMVLNEINNIRIDGKPITVELKKEIYNDLFVNSHRNITKKQLTNWLMENNYIKRDEEVIISGIDDQIKSKLTTLHDMKKIFDNKLPETAIVDNIVYWITLFSDSRDMLEEKIKEEYKNILTSTQINQLKNKNYGGWGRLSKELLEDLVDDENSIEPRSIIQSLYETNYNLMELLTDQFSYAKEIEIRNQQNIDTSKDISYELIDELPVSPAVKRPVWQTIRIMEELKDITGKAPKKIFIEMARGGGIQGRRTVSRKNQLLELYKSINNEPELLGILENTEESQLRRKKLYLYYTQKGICMYTHQHISLDELYDENIYDLDHIYPRSTTKDDSLNNLVLVRKDSNQKKGNKYPIHSDVQKKMSYFWKGLREQGFISNNKYNRLIRKDDLTDAEKADFISRQLVETRQSTKIVSNIIKELYPETEVVFIKAQVSADFRNNQKNPNRETGEINPAYQNYIKLRGINDFHHAKDAYLNIVVGNVYHTQFTSNPLNYIKQKDRQSYNLAKVFDRKVKRNGELAWMPGTDGSIKMVNRMMKRHDILTTYMVMNGKGGLFDQQIMPKSKGQVPIKKGRDIAKYGGYNKASISHYTVVEHDRGKRRIRTLESIPLYIAEQVKDSDKLKEYLTKEHKLKNIQIIYQHIPARNALIETSGIKARITGKTGNAFVLRNEHQLILNENMNRTLKEIEKYKRPTNTLELNRFQTDRESLESIYRELVEKANHHLYKEKLNNFISLLTKGKETIAELDNEELVDLILEVMKLYRSTRENSNLTSIGGARTAGVFKIGKNLSNQKELFLVNQSITGLFENRVNLLK